MKSVLLINAGAVIAVLAFYSGHVDLMLSTDSRIPALYKMLLNALFYWAIGVWISTMAYGATFLIYTITHEQSLNSFIEEAVEEKLAAIAK